jgi:hypothetical protein
MAKHYNDVQTVTIQEGWYALQRMIEGSSKMERRLALCEKEQRKHFPAVAARSFVLHHVREGLRLCNNAAMVETGILRNRSGDDDEHVLAMAIGMHYSDHPKALEVLASLNAVARAESEAQEAFLKSL